MKIKIMSALVIAAIAFFGLKSFTTAQDATAKDPKVIFTEAKCNMCHSVTAAEIESKKKSGAIDLSATGSKHNADFMTKYLKKEESINDKKHPVAFKGEEADLTTMVAWLETLKGETK